MIGSFVSGDLSSNTGQSELLTGLGTIMGGCILAFIVSWIILKQFGNSSAVQQLVLDVEVTAPQTKPVGTLSVGEIAVALTDLRPSGKIQWDSAVFDATTTGGWIAEGAKVRIMQCGMTIEVEEIDT